MRKGLRGVTYSSKGEINKLNRNTKSRPCHKQVEPRSLPWRMKNIGAHRHKHRHENKMTNHDEDGSGRGPGIRTPILREHINNYINLDREATCKGQDGRNYLGMEETDENSFVERDSANTEEEIKTSLTVK